MVTENNRPGGETEAAQSISADSLELASRISAQTDKPNRLRGDAAETPRTELVAEFARMVLNLDHLVGVINTLNKLDHRCGLDAAIRSGRAFYGRAKDDVLAVDYDEDGSIEAANRLYWSARMMGLPTLLIASGQPNRRHVFVWTIDAHQRSELALLAKADGGDVRPNIRPPLAPHRLYAEGVEARILRGQDPVLAFGRTGELATKSWRTAIRLAVLKDGSTYQSRSEFIGAAALAAVNAGWTVDEVEDLLE